MTHRTWIIGLDGATFDLITPWVEGGHLPAFGRLLDEGSWGEARSTIPPITGPAWTTFITGTNPGRHGIYDWVKRREDSYDFPPVTGDHRLQASLWQIASQAGKKVLALNIPMTYPPEDVNGLVLAGLPATRLTTSPPELADEIISLIPDYVVYPDPGQAYSDQGIDAFLKRVSKANAGLKTLWQELIQREEWDIAMMVFNSTDVIQHAMWRFMDPTHPRHKQEEAEKYGNEILAVYQEMDRFLAEIMDSMDEDTTLMVMSDHGFGPFNKFFHVNSWLMEEGLLVLKKTPFALLKSALFKLGFSPMPIYEKMMQFGMGRFKREVVRGKGQGFLRKLFVSFDEVDWNKTKAYSYGNIGQIRINLKGREPEGIIEPGEDYDALMADIISRLEKIKDPETGELIIEHIYPREDIYSGDAFEAAPDILFLPLRLEYFGFGEYEFGDHRILAQVKHGISGTHRMNGICIVWGDKISKGKLQDVSLKDFAPTILHLSGLPIPAHMDGRPMIEILREDAGFPAPENGPPWEGREFQEDDLSEDDEEKIRQRLRDLGYVS